MSEANLKETPPMVLARRKSAAYKVDSTSRKLVELMTDMETASGPVKEENFKPQRVKTKRRPYS